MTGGFTGEIRRRFGYRKHHEKTAAEAGVTHLLTKSFKDWHQPPGAGQEAWNRFSVTAQREPTLPTP